MIDAFATSMQASAYKQSRFGNIMTAVSNAYKTIAHMDVNSKIVQLARKRVHNEVATSSKPRTEVAYSDATVFEKMATRWQLKESHVETVRNTAIFHLSEDGCTRGHDLVGLRVFNQSYFTWHDKNANEHTFPVVTVSNIDDVRRQIDVMESRCVGFRVRYANTKTTGEKPSPWITFQRIRAARVGRNARYKDTICSLAAYMRLTLANRCLLDPKDEGTFITLEPCKVSKRPPKCSKKLARHCGGKCGQYHQLSSDSINNERTATLRFALGDNVLERSHAMRGSSASTMMAGSKVSTLYNADEAKIRARFSQPTFEKHYSKPVPVATTMALQEHPQKHDLRPEEVLRILPKRARTQSSR